MFSHSKGIPSRASHRDGPVGITEMGFAHNHADSYFVVMNHAHGSACSLFLLSGSYHSIQMCAKVWLFRTLVLSLSADNGFSIYGSRGYEPFNLCHEFLLGPLTCVCLLKNNCHCNPL